MTVHGAKGLEAPIVFLPDTCSTATGGPVSDAARSRRRSTLPDGVDGTPFVWSVKGTGGARRHRRGASSERNAARSRGAPPAALRRHDARARPALRRGLRGQERRVRPAAGTSSSPRRCAARSPRSTAPTAARSAPRRGADRAARGRASTASTRERAPPPLPPWATRAAPREPALRIPLAPSRLEAYAPDEAGEPLAEPPRARAPTTSRRLCRRPAARGRQPLPARHAHPRVAAAPADAAAARLGQGGDRLHRPSAARRSRRRARKGIVTETLAILSAPSSRPCSARRAAPRCRSSRCSPTPSGRGRRSSSSARSTAWSTSATRC